MTTTSFEEEVEVLPPAQRDAKGRLLPGQRSINPAGRPAIIRDIRDAAKGHTRTALNVLIKCMTDHDTPPAARIAAATAILDRGWGKPQQSLEARIGVENVGATAAEVLMRLTEQAKQAREARIVDVTPATSTQS